MSLKYRAYLPVLCIWALASLASWYLESANPTQPFFNWIYLLGPGLCAVLVGLLLWKKERAIRKVELTVHAAVAIYFLAKMVYTLYLAEYSDLNRLEELAEVASWSPVVYFVAYLAFGPRRGLLWSVSFYVALLLVGLPFIVTEIPFSNERVYELQGLVNLYLSNATFLVIAFIFALVSAAYLRQYLASRVLQRQARTDYLTGLFNRRFIYEALGREIEEASRYGRPLSVVFFDIDDFKAINDSWGHQAGDRALREIARLVGKHLRNADLLSRWGGEEFLVLAPETTVEQAKLSATRLKRIIGGHALKEGGGVTASFGIAEYRAGDTVESLLKQADDALHQAKRKGKNRIEVTTTQSEDRSRDRHGFA